MKTSKTITNKTLFAFSSRVFIPSAAGGKKKKEREHAVRRYAAVHKISFPYLLFLSCSELHYVAGALMQSYIIYVRQFQHITHRPA